MQHATPHRCPRLTRDALVSACLVLTLLMSLVAYWALLEPWRGGEGTSGERTGGAGGQGDGTGSGMSGTGTGAGLQGDGPGADPKGTSDELQGTPDGATTQTVAPPSGTDAPQTTQRAAPEFGFTAPDEPQVQQPRTNPLPAMPIGTGSGIAREGAAGAASPGVPEFMGIRGEGKDVVYVLDFSGSMGGEKITYLKIELKRSIFALTPKNTFQVILFNDREIENPTPGMLPASKANTRSCATWIDQRDAGGGTNPTVALEIALTKLQPETIYLLTDGVFNSEADVFDVIAKHNAERKVQINTIGFGADVNVATLERIARENRGSYRFVSPPTSPPP